jgi:hypothetical protein
MGCGSSAENSLARVLDVSAACRSGKCVSHNKVGTISKKSTVCQCTSADDKILPYKQNQASHSSALQAGKILDDSVEALGNSSSSIQAIKQTTSITKHPILTFMTHDSKLDEIEVPKKTQVNNSDAHPRTTLRSVSLPSISWTGIRKAPESDNSERIITSASKFVNTKVSASNTKSYIHKQREVEEHNIQTLPLVFHSTEPLSPTLIRKPRTPKSLELLRNSGRYSHANHATSHRRETNSLDPQLRTRNSPKISESQLINSQSNTISPGQAVQTSKSNSALYEVQRGIDSRESHPNQEQKERELLMPVSECNPSVEMSSTLHHLKHQLCPDDITDKQQHRHTSMHTGRAMLSPHADPHLHNKAVLSSSSSISFKYSHWPSTRGRLLDFGLSSSFGINLKLKVNKQNYDAPNERKQSFTLKVLPTKLDNESSKDIERTSYRSISPDKEGMGQPQVQHKEKLISVRPKVMNTGPQQSIPVTQASEIAAPSKDSRQIIRPKGKDKAHAANTPSRKKRLSWAAAGRSGDSHMSGITAALETARANRLTSQNYKGSCLSIMDKSQHQSQQCSLDNDEVHVSQSHQALDSLVSIPNPIL